MAWYRRAWLHCSGVREAAIDRGWGVLGASGFVTRALTAAAIFSRRSTAAGTTEYVAPESTMNSRR
jgi:hypothetical protein